MNGTYNPYYGATSCTPCPKNSTTLFDGATSLSDCVCESGYYLNPNPETILPDGTYKCLECPEGALCEGLHTIHPIAQAVSFLKND